MWESILGNDSHQMASAAPHHLQQHPTAGQPEQHLAAKHPVTPVHPHQHYEAPNQPSISTRQLAPSMMPQPQCHAAASHLVTIKKMQQHTAANQLHASGMSQHLAAKYHAAASLRQQQPAIQQYPFQAAQMSAPINTQQQPFFPRNHPLSGQGVQLALMPANIQPTEGAGHSVKYQKFTSLPSYVSSQTHSQQEAFRANHSFSPVRPWEVESPSLPSVSESSDSSVLNTPQLDKSLTKLQPHQITSSPLQQPLMKSVATFQQTMKEQMPPQLPQSTDTVQDQLSTSISKRPVPTTQQHKPRVPVKRKLEPSFQKQVVDPVNGKRTAAPAKLHPNPAEPRIAQLQPTEEVSLSTLHCHRPTPSATLPQQPVIQTTVNKTDQTSSSAPRDPHHTLPESSLLLSMAPQSPQVPTPGSLSRAVHHNLASLLAFITQSTPAEATEVLQPIAKRRKMQTKEPAPGVNSRKKKPKPKKICPVCPK